MKKPIAVRIRKGNFRTIEMNNEGDFLAFIVSPFARPFKTKAGAKRAMIRWAKLYELPLKWEEDK